MDPKPSEDEGSLNLQELHIEEKGQENDNSNAEPIQDEFFPNLEEVEEIIEHKFNNKNLLEEAFTHASFQGTDKGKSYERLEFVGDSVLNLLFSKYHFFLYPNLPPGSLTLLRAANVDTEKLARVALKHGFYKYLRHKKPLLQEQIQEFTQDVMDYPFHSNGLVNAPKALADIVESLIGAVFIDTNSSPDTVWKVFKRLLEPIINPKTYQKHPVSELNELCQKKGWKVKFSTDLSKKVVYVYVMDHLVGKAAYCIKNKRNIAENRAAKYALAKTENILDQINNTNKQIDDGQVVKLEQGLQMEDKEDENSEAESTETESLPSLQELEVILDYKFNNQSLLEEAYTHTSFPGTCISYERLEYVGDSVLNLLFAKELYFLYPDLPPGSLTRLRAANVDTEKLARVALKHGLHKYLRHKKPLLKEQIREFTTDIMDYPLHSNGLVNPPKALADIVESLIGAVFVDSSSLDTVWKVFKSLLEPIVNLKTLGKHPMSALYELCQKRGWKLKFVTDLPNNVVDVFVMDKLVGRATYHLNNKKDIAQNRAAKDALDKIECILGQINGTDNTENHRSVDINP